ncbi:ABC transporter ATP-binding protein [Candidatus Falkowbacteria bacterium]|nr:ABC transporter ATP-binding protein [Candidatus Falkowbacteria bacterium]
MTTDKSQNEEIINLSNISKSFFENGKEISILKDLNLTVRRGEKIGIIGPSGSGKSTILSIMAGLDRPDAGEVIVNSKNLNNLSEVDLAKFRNQDIGIIFQSFELILPFTVKENVAAPQEISGASDNDFILSLLESVKLSQKTNSGVNNLSGGEKQRTAIARSLSNKPEIILADEPTGSLDRITGKSVLDLLINLTEEENKVLIIITHDEEIAKKMDRVYVLKDRKLILI